MPANVETMCYVRGLPIWHGLGNPVDGAMSSEEALRMGSVGWRVNSIPIFVNGKVAPGYVANVRDTDGRILGIVTDEYKIYQNSEAFAFVDSLLHNDETPVTFETAGSLAGGKRVWMLAHLPRKVILGDIIDPYFVLANSHDGKGSLIGACTPTRVVCENTLNLAVGTAKRKWTIRHVGDLASKQDEAARTLGFVGDYMNGLEKKAEELQQKAITKEDLDDIVNMVFPIDEENDTDRVKKNVSELRNQFFDVFTMADDLKPFRGDAWGVYNAFGDFASHIKARRQTSTFNENRFASFIDGNKILEAAQKAIEAVVV